MRSQLQKRLQTVIPLWPWVVVILFGFWMTSPLWGSLDKVFMGRLSGDNITSPWFYDFVAQQVWNGESLSTLHGFDYPQPLQRKVEFPNYWDAVILSPLVEWLGWPQFWGPVLSWSVLINAMSLALLARVMGCRHWGIVLAGCLGVLLRPMWTDMGFGRMNVITPGYAIFALAGALYCIPRSQGSYKIRIFWFLFSVFFGWLAAIVYPPFLLLLVPFGVACLSWRYESEYKRWLLLPVAAAILAFALASFELFEMLDGYYRQPKCSIFECPDAYHRMTVESLFLWQQENLSILGLPATFWGFALLSLGCQKQYRPSVSVIWLIILLYAILSLGPCPMWSEQTSMQLPETVQTMLRPLWCVAVPLHDFARFAGILVCALSLLAAIGLEGLLLGRSTKQRVGLIAVVLAVLALQVSQMLTSILDMSKWQRPVRSPIATFLLQQAGEPALELPYDKGSHILSHLYAPQSPRVNPLRFTDRTRSKWVFFQWADAIGRGEKPQQIPTAEQIRGSGVRWVFYEPSRCTGDLQRGCRPWVLLHLQEVLGRSTKLTPTVRYWDLQ